jgi:transposase-like protein
MKTMAEHQKERAEAFKQSQMNLLKTGIECPHCKEIEMLKFDAYSVLASWPGKYRVYCPQCKKEQFILA